MTKTKKQLRAEAVERLKNCVAARFDAESIVIALTSGRHGQSDWSLECDKLIYLLTDDDSTISEVDSTAERGMTNLEWLYEHDEYFNSFAKLIAFLRGFSTDEFTANEWLRQEHYEPNPDCSAMLYRMYTENMKHEPCSDYEPKNDVDSRERLEADAFAYLQTAYITYPQIIELLDRQAAITEREATKRHEIFCETCEAESDKQIAELRAELEKATNNLNSANEDFENARAELVAERDYWKEQFMHCLTVAIRQERGDVLDRLMSYPRPADLIEPYQLVTDEVYTLRDFLAESEKERELYRKKQDERDELQAQADEKWNLYVAEHRRADINAADREMYREATSALVDSITDGLRKVNSILDGKDEGLA